MRTCSTDAVVGIQRAPPPSPVAPSVPVGCLANEKTRNPSHISTETHTHTEQSRGTNCIELAKGRIQPRKKRGWWFPSPALDRSAFLFLFFLLLSRIPSIIESPERMQRERQRGEELERREWLFFYLLLTRYQRYSPARIDPS